MVVSAILVAGEGSQASSLSKVLAVVALLLGVINVVGGYLVADRMLAKFKNTKSGKKG